MLQAYTLLSSSSEDRAFKMSILADTTAIQLQLDKAKSRILSNPDTPRLCIRPTPDVGHIHIDPMAQFGMVIAGRPVVTVFAYVVYGQRCGYDVDLRA